MSEIISIWIKRAHGESMDSVDEAELVEGRGLAGNADQGGWRQITVIEARTSWFAGSTSRIPEANNYVLAIASSIFEARIPPAV